MRKLDLGRGEPGSAFRLGERVGSCCCCCCGGGGAAVKIVAVLAAAGAAGPKPALLLPPVVDGESGSPNSRGIGEAEPLLLQKRWYTDMSIWRGGAKEKRGKLFQLL
jgi:hypothetical protein